MRPLENLDRLEKLCKKPYFLAAEARDAGVHPSLLSYYAKRKLLERIGRGVYRDPQNDLGVDFQWEDLIYTALSIPQGVVCLVSALAYYGMTDEIPREHWIAIPHSATAPKREGVRIVRTRNPQLGIETLKEGKVSFQIYNRERTIIDAFRLLSKEVAIKALRSYLSPPERPKAQPKKARSILKNTSHTDQTLYPCPNHMNQDLERSVKDKILSIALPILARVIPRVRIQSCPRIRDSVCVLLFRKPNYPFTHKQEMSIMLGSYGNLC